LAIDNNTLETMNILANGYANERIEFVLDVIMESLLNPENASTQREAIKNEVGRALAVSFSKGYADCFERIGPKKLIF